MGKVNDKLLEIEEYLSNGYDVEDTALILDVPVEWVTEAAKYLESWYSDSEFGKLE